MMGAKTRHSAVQLLLPPRWHCAGVATAISVTVKILNPAWCQRAVTARDESKAGAPTNETLDGHTASCGAAETYTGP